ncbi:MAG TPA: hypothetical protein DER60_12355 [Syntrophomonas sp.]|nr:hypothetical protein [Syntrophomonas sp.]
MAYAVLGPCGTFSEEAARRYWGAGVELTTVEDLDIIGRLLADRQVQGALVPLHNTITGWVNSTLKLFKTQRLAIQGQIDIPVAQHLMACNPYDLQDLEVVISHPLALEQCRDFIAFRLNGVKLEHLSSTAGAAQVLRSEPRRAASIGSVQAARLYGLKIIQHNINRPGNITCFVHIESLRKAPFSNRSQARPSAFRPCRDRR